MRGVPHMREVQYLVAPCFEYSSYNRYAKFLLRGNSVINWETQGVNEEVIDKKIQIRNFMVAFLSPIVIGTLLLVWL